jgi:phosphoribosylaminoimidazole-succinocarboxamide synthase
MSNQNNAESRQDFFILFTQGKVRDTYDLGDKMIIVTTDRQSAFDRHLASIPFKGQVGLDA